MTQVYVKGVNGELRTFIVTVKSEILSAYSAVTKISESLLFINSSKILDPLSAFQISLKVLGGKGGFGSLLRGQGMIARTDNFEACRDLHGRRIRDVNNEIRLAEWKQKQEEKKKNSNETEPETSELPQKRSNKIDKKYKEEVKKSIQGVRSALSEGLRKLKKTEE